LIRADRCLVGPENFEISTFRV